MGYPVDNKINKETLLYVYIGANAIEENRQESFNRYFKEADVNATLMPLNIREDDLGFFIHNFKNSKISAAYFAQEYWPLVAQLLQSTGTIDEEQNLIDSLKIIDGTYEADFVFPGAIIETLMRKCDICHRRMTLIGASDLTLSIVKKLTAYQYDELAFYDERVENLITYEKLAGNTSTDINRIQNKEIVLSDSDIVIDTIGKYKLIYENDVLCSVLTEAHPSHHNNNAYTLHYDDIFDTITEIKTREWIDNGRF